MTPLAVIAKEAGIKVSGCDIDSEFITDEVLEKAGIKPLVEFSSSHIQDVDLVITTGAHGGYDNPEVIAAKNLKIEVWTQGQAVGEFMKGDIFKKVFDGISVSGSHGKTTTTALIAVILKECRLDPTFLVGTGNIAYLNSCGHFGKGKYFVAEADEYASEPKYDKTPKLLWQKPHIAVITNIELDHPDLYDNIEDLKKAFIKFTNNVSSKGCVVACVDDRETENLTKEISGRIITYGFSKNADFYIDKVSIEKEKMFFWVNSGNASLGEFILNITGEHNALNALAAIVVCLELGISISSIKAGLTKFNGSKRRAEYIKDLESGAILYDDYAHHPTEIKKTLQAFKKTFVNRKILCIFQPHTYSRTKKLFEQFKYSFSNADEVIFIDIYSSQREEKDTSVSSSILSNEVSKILPKTQYLPSISDVVEYVDQKGYGSDWLILTMGAGDVYKIASMLN